MKSDIQLKADVTAELAWDPAINATDVRGIALDLDVKLAPEHKRSDSEIAQAAITALRLNSSVPDGKVKVEVDKLEVEA